MGFGGKEGVDVAGHRGKKKGVLEERKERAVNEA